MTQDGGFGQIWGTEIYRMGQHKPILNGLGRSSVAPAWSKHSVNVIAPVSWSLLPLRGMETDCPNTLLQPPPQMPIVVLLGLSILSQDLLYRLRPEGLQGKCTQTCLKEREECDCSVQGWTTLRRSDTLTPQRHQSWKAVGWDLTPGLWPTTRCLLLEGLGHLRAA